MSVWCWVTCILVLQILKQINGYDLVRLTNKGADDGSYTVEVHYDQKWRTICGRHWSSANARVVCRQTGQPATRCVAEFRLSKDLEEEEAEAVNLNYQCMGNETALHRCPYDFSSTHGSRIYTSCSRQPRFAVICGTQCPAWRYGEDCLPCPCNQNNTEKCDDKSGKCTCKAGFSGETCDCQDGKHTCNPTTSFCHMDNGNPVCLCKKGVTSTSQNKCNGFGLRFADRAANDTGEVEFYNNGTWNALCIMRSSNTEIVDVICRQLGLPIVHTSAFLSKYIPKTDLPDYQIAETMCEGTETSLVDCKMTMVPAMSCNIAVGIMCSSACPNWRFGEKCNLCSCNKTNSESCDPSTGECKCKSGFTGATCDCLQGNNPCNETISECHAQLGKPTCLCKTEFIHKNYSCTDPIRLANLTTTVTTSGSKLYEGRVELYINGSWGTICDDAAHPGVKMIEVLCRNLGLPSTYLDYAGTAYYGMGTGPIHYTFVHCTGKEASVSQCYTSTSSYCSHSEDLGIRCGEECPDFRFGSDCLNCQCVRSNTQFCNKTSGECVCKDGYEGQTCSCQKGKHMCNLQTSICENNMCYCKFENNETKSSCFERLRLDKENGSYLQYHANNQWNYLCNSATSSRFSTEQILCRVLHQPTKITKLEVKYSSPVGYKFTVDESCRNPWLPNRAECLTFENTSTACYNGIVTLQCLEECPDGMYFKELGFGCEKCRCNMKNTKRCDKTGKCICKSGYEGALCDCVKNTCNTAVAFCQNNQNGTKCLCKPGYENRGYNCEDSMRLELSNQSYFKRVKYKIDSSWVYASNPSSYVSSSERGVCVRMGLPTFYNKLGVETIHQLMNLTDFECMNKEYVALSLNYSECINQNRPRYYFAPSSNLKTASCLKECPKMMFYNTTSFECVLCSCNNNNTVSCNQTTGECKCKAGFFGPSCDCIQNQHNCNNTYSYCSFQGSAPTCTCRLGFYGKNLGCFEPLRFIRNTGVLELYDRGEWKLISTSYKWNDDESKVICRQLGLPTFYVRYTTKSRSATNLRYSEYNNKKKLTYLSCSGEETEISQCSFSTSSYISSYTSFAIVECRRDCPDFLYGPTCKRCECNQLYSRYCNKTTGECVCKSGYSGDTCDCVQGSHFCNATFAFCGLPTPSCYCRDQYNRRGLKCKDSLQFYNNVNGSKGVLQIYKNESWNTFCDDSFARDEALVACRQLRLPTRYITFATIKYSQRIPGEYNLGIVYTIQCNGNETSLSDCKKFSTHGSYCSHSEDVYLQCLSECPKWTYGDECENLCVCNQTNSLSCDEDTGKCSCKPGYFGEFCNCKTGVHKCNTAISICHTNSSGDGVCLCKAGLSDRDYQNEGCYKEYVRLINQTSSNEAAVEMFHSGMWGGICKTGWTKKNAQVVCQQFGLPSDKAQMIRSLTTMPSSYFSWTDITCNGTEKSLLDCVRSTSSSTYCYGRKAAVIVCPKNPWIRLIQETKTRTKTSGMLQVYHNNKWGYVCESGFSDNDALVACRELGLPTKYAKDGSGRISGSGSVTHLKYVGCNGDEESLADCSASNGSYCYSYSRSRVKISCDSVCPDMKYGENCQLTCPCNRQNTASCDIETGQCVCKSGYTGFSCGCTAGSHNCNTTVSDCHKESGKVLCICKKGYTSSKHGCIENVRINSDKIVQLFEMDGWKYACRNSFWSRKNALVLCRQLNQSSDILYSTSRYRSYGYQFSTSKRVITCNGTEEMLADCPYTVQTSCSYNAKIMCGNCPNWTYSSDCSKSCDCNREYSLGCDVNNGTCICRDNFKGDDCSCHAATADPCSGQHSKCKFDRCICEEGSFNQSASCSDLKDTIYYCSFQTYSWRDTCSIRTLNSRSNRHGYVSSSSWRPKAGSDNFNYLYVDTRPYYISADSYFNEMNLTLQIARKQFCLYFDYVVNGRGTIIVSTIDSMNLESTVATLSGQSPKNWTTKYTEINGKRPINQIKITMGERTAIDRIVAAGTSCVCPDWTFGQDCDKCACVRMHTQSCDRTRGTCQCKAGYTGEACQCEDNGKPCLHDIRLVNGNTTNMGRVEVVTDGIWSTVCDQNWDDNDATVVCKHLEIAKYGIAVLNAGFGKGIGPVHVDRVNCQGNETDFMECPFTQSSCDHSDDAGVICVNISSVIRLRGGSDKTQGRLEIKIDGSSWGTVCDDGFSVEDARVACRQLELPTRNVQAKTSAYYGQGTGRILLSNLQCNGNEISIQSCPATKYPSSYSCGHYEDVGISCSNDCPLFKYGEKCENDCVCDQRTSLSCDKDTGECKCEDGWTGPLCSCGNNMKCDENSYCDGSKCLCIDGFFTKPSNCSDDKAVVYSCSFETDFDVCSIVNYGKMKWKKDSSGTPSDDTGPYTAKRGKYYVYTEATSKSTGDKGVMEIPLDKLNSTRYNCFQFYFHMRGDDMGDLNITTEDRFGSNIARWSKSGHYGSRWDRGYVALSADTFKIKITGIRGNGYQSDIALDDFKILQGHCVCDKWKYGLMCEKSCNCRRSSSESCDSQTGSCVCRSGWSGKTCNCMKATDTCHVAYSYCHGNQCLCKDGQYDTGVTCSGMNDITYFCSFDLPHSVDQCKIELFPMKWDIEESTRHSINDDYHLDDNRYLMTRVSTLGNVYIFTLRNITLKSKSCLQVKYFARDPTKQMLRIQVIKDNHLMSNKLFQGRDWSTARVSLAAASHVKIHFMAYIYNSLPVLIDDIIITAKDCGACSQWYYGSDCEKMSKCNRTNTLSFDNNDLCNCKRNWYGEWCDCLKAQNDACVKQGEVCRESTCTCKDGYTRAGTGCRDINECKNVCKSPLQICTNGAGSYKCVCKNGTFGDGNICSESVFAVTNGSRSQEGTLLMWRDNAWGTVCQPFDLIIAMKACKTIFPGMYGIHLARKGYKSPNGISYSSVLRDHIIKGSDYSEYGVSIQPCDTEKNAVYLTCGVCGGIYKNQFGLVEPPLQTPANTLCYFLLSPFNAKSINATFISFSMNLNNNNETQSKRSIIWCGDTYLEIYDGTDMDSPFLGRYCGSRPRFTINSKGNSLFVVYRTSRDTSKHDFQMIYRTEKNVEDPHALGERCSHSTQCVANNASCISNRCSCHREYYMFDTATCLQKKHWNSSCLRPEECKTGYCDTENSLCSCPTYSEIDVENEECTAKPAPLEQPENSAVWLVPLVVFILLIIIILIAIIIVFARRKGYILWRRGNDATFTYSELMSATNPLYGFSADDKSSHRGSVISINQSGDDESHRIRLSNFGEIYESMCDNVNWPEEEFQNIIQISQQRPTDIGAASQNRHKNRNGDILPYDYNRLRESGTTSVADYINASVIEGLHSHYPYYIVTQYPLVSTQNDFWRMVWKQRVSSVIGLVSSNEKEVYFPTKTGMTRTFGNIKVQTLSTLTVHRCTFRCLKILKGSKSHTVNHFQSSFLSNFTKDECGDLVNLVNLVHSNAEAGHDSRPMVVHCLNGTGKSGLFVAMDYLLQLINNGDTHIDIFKLTQILVNNRVKLIENETQYQFLYECVEFYLEHRKSSQFQKDSEFNFTEEEDTGLIEISPTDKTTFFTKKH
ncbi:uncharacterized protein LOC125645464 isoform X2 [Ostrea edulis]|uniref:uncharacterized protein LOC125645464 isoform X2 n=1 Tax=Ostrea edulis TaxID=37623 RepID=UPI0024AF780F|nr:uncharacterized protein LOC125645464 isoform X2 [Ostrea edulis]